MKRILKLLYFRLKLYPKKVTIHAGCNIAIHSKFEGNNVIGKNTTFNGNLGLFSYIADNACISGNIGRYCSIASEVKVLIGIHPLSDFVSTSPVFYSLLKQSNVTFVSEQYFKEFVYADESNKYAIVVGNDVWIGARAILISGIKIGDGAVILANATVTKDVPPYSIVGGVPAKIIKNRFDNETIEFLLKFKWWDKSEKWLAQHSSSFRNIKHFIEIYNC